MTNSRLQDKSKRANCASELCNDFDIKLLRFSPLASATAATSVHQGVTHMVSLDLSCRSVRFRHCCVETGASGSGSKM